MKAKTKKAAVTIQANGVEHRRRGGLYDLGFDDFGMGLGMNSSLGLEILGAGVVGGAGVGLIEMAEGYYPEMVKGKWLTPIIRMGIGIAAGVGLLNYANFPGSKMLGWGLGTALTASGALDLKKTIGMFGAQKKVETEMKNTETAPAQGVGDELLYGVGDAPISIREQQLAGAPISARDVSAVEQQLQGDYSYLQ